MLDKMLSKWHPVPLYNHKNNDLPLCIISKKKVNLIFSIDMLDIFADVSYSRCYSQLQEHQCWKQPTYNTLNSDKPFNTTES